MTDDASRITRLEAQYHAIQVSISDLKAAIEKLTERFDAMHPDVLALRVAQALERVGELQGVQASCRTDCTSRLNTIENWKSEMKGRLAVLAAVVAMFSSALVGWVKELLSK